MYQRLGAYLLTLSSPPKKLFSPSREVWKDQVMATGCSERASCTLKEKLKAAPIIRQETR